MQDDQDLDIFSKASEIAEEAEVSHRDAETMTANWTGVTLPHCSTVARSRKSCKEKCCIELIHDLRP